MNWTLDWRLTPEAESCLLARLKVNIATANNYGLSTSNVQDPTSTINYKNETYLNSNIKNVE